MMVFVSLMVASAWAQEDKLLKMCEEENNSVACFKIGDQKRVLDRDNKAALKYYLKACDGGHMTACNFAGIFTQMKGKQYSKQWKEAFKLYEKACNAGEDGACFNIGSLKYKEGRAKSAKKYYKIACDMKNEVACNNLKKLER